MKSIKYINEALKTLDLEVEKILLDTSLSLNRKDDLMLPLVEEKKILQKTLKELEELKNNPPKNLSCGISRYRDD